MAGEGAIGDLTSQFEHLSTGGKVFAFILAIGSIILIVVWWTSRNNSSSAAQGLTTLTSPSYASGAPVQGTSGASGGTVSSGTGTTTNPNQVSLDPTSLAALQAYNASAGQQVQPAQTGTVDPATLALLAGIQGEVGVLGQLTGLVLTNATAGPSVTQNTQSTTSSPAQALNKPAKVVIPSSALQSHIGITQTQAKATPTAQQKISAALASTGTHIATALKASPPAQAAAPAKTNTLPKPTPIKAPSPAPAKAAPKPAPKSAPLPAAPKKTGISTGAKAS